MKEAAPLTMEIMQEYLRDLVDRRFYGTIEITLSAGELSHFIEKRSRPIFEVAAQVYRESENVELRSRLEGKFETDGKFRKLAGIEKKG